MIDVVSVAPSPVRLYSTRRGTSVWAVRAMMPSAPVAEVL
jgi:hypothetical protein